MRWPFSKKKKDEPEKPSKNYGCDSCYGHLMQVGGNACRHDIDTTTWDPIKGNEVTYHYSCEEKNKNGDCPQYVQKRCLPLMWPP